MRKLLLPFLIFIVACGSNNNQPDTKTENSDYLISLDGIGALKLDMPLVELEKLLQKKITLKVIDVDSVQLTETIKEKYKGIDVEIDLIKLQGYTTVDGIRTSSPLCKTKSGIGIGSTKLQIIAAYEGYHIDARPDFSMDGDAVQKSQTSSSVTVKEDEEGNAIVFNLLNNKVVSFVIYPIYDDEEG